MRPQLVGLAERGELRDRAQAAAAQIEVRSRPEHPEHELRHQPEELGRELLRRQLLSARARPPELARDLEPAGHQVVCHVESAIVVASSQSTRSTIFPKCSLDFIKRCASAASRERQHGVDHRPQATGGERVAEAVAKRADDGRLLLDACGRAASSR